MVPWRPLQLDLDDALVAALAQLRQHVEMIGYAAYHTADADFVQTREDRTVSHFYDVELRARRDRLQALVTNQPMVTPPFGPLQTVFVLPPSTPPARLSNCLRRRKFVLILY